jgi:hypothetical protein
MFLSLSKVTTTQLSLPHLQLLFQKGIAKKMTSLSWFLILFALSLLIPNFVSSSAVKDPKQVVQDVQR